MEVVWLEFIGVVSECYVRRYIHLLILFPPTPLVLALFYSSIPTSLFILKMFYRSCLMLFLCNIANSAQRTFEII